MTGAENWTRVVADALQSMKAGPKNLPAMVSLLGDADVTGTQIVDHVSGAGVNDPALVQMVVGFSRWDADDEHGDGKPGSPERRMWILDALGLGRERHDRLLLAVPISVDGSVIISTHFEPWYEGARPLRSSMYWTHYIDYLRDQKKWPAESLGSLDSTTTHVIERLSDPQRDEARQTKGLVVGYVQSGKTANFTGVAAKAIDAGYRLVIVLTGTIEVLRAQTQLRMDKELVGRENILDGLDPSEPAVARQLDYQQHEDWIDGRFVEHGAELLRGQAPKILRLTTHGADYKSLTAGRTQIRFEGLDPNKPLNHPDNLARSGAYVAVVKKNPAALKKLIADIKPFKRRGELPVLIIDDESDQASVDTTNPKKYTTGSAEQRKRTTINRLLSEFLHLLPRAQYVGYTATPFANVFIDPDDERDLFPSHFILSLQRPPGYMGVANFHDLNRRYDDEPKSVATSNEVALVRSLVADPVNDPDDRLEELGTAIDAFVLSGAVKLFRQATSGRRFRHHTMLVHESVKRIAHADAAQDVREIWSTRGFTDPTGLDRLRALWSKDFEPVCRARAEGEAVPANFDELAPFVAAAVAKLSTDADPVAVMNSDKDVSQRSVDFEADEVWRILVGGTQLSRGFTIEGLTVSYFRRQTMQADTLMQAGRWFGFRAGYTDLVRLYIRRDGAVDLYEAFEALLQDEESFREELEQYAGLTEEGLPKVEPWQVPPLVSQHLPWLRPTARNKMWNAKVESKGGGGKAMDFAHHPPRTSPARRHNLEVVGLPLLRATTQKASFAFDVGDASGTFQARVGHLEATELLELLRPGSGMTWHEQYAPTFGPTYKYLRNATSAGHISGWQILWPQVGKPTSEWSDDIDGPVTRVDRKLRDSPRTDFVGSDRKHRDVAERLAGTEGKSELVDAARDGLTDPSGTTGVLLAYLAQDVTSADDDGPRTERVGDRWKDDVVLFSLVLPPKAVRAKENRIQWTVQVKTRDGEAVVPVE